MSNGQARPPGGRAERQLEPYPAAGSVRIDSLRLAVTALVWDAEGRILLQLRSDNGHWGLPGGGVEPGESLTRALRREVEEETGYLVEPVRLVGVYSDPELHQLTRYPDGNVVHYVSCTFECRLLEGEAATCEETSAIAWRAPAELPEPFVPAHRIRLADALARREAAFVR